MIPNHARFIEAIKDRMMVSVKFYSKADSGVLERVCAPMDYGPGEGSQDGLNRYWLWDETTTTGSQKFGLVSQQIVELQVLGEGFDREKLVSRTAPVPAEPASRSTPPAAVPSAALK